MGIVEKLEDLAVKWVAMQGKGGPELEQGLEGETPKMKNSGKHDLLYSDQWGIFTSVMSKTQNN